MLPIILGVGAVVLVLFVTLIWLASRYRRCPSDKILVVYGKVAGGQSGHADCQHGVGRWLGDHDRGSALRALTSSFGSARSARSASALSDAGERPPGNRSSVWCLYNI